MLLRENVYEKLRADILSCELAPGDDMREQELAERYAVSRQPVREALLRLEREHLVTVQPRQGYRVNPISLADARDLLRFRLALEPACVGATERSSFGANAFTSGQSWSRTSEPVASLVAPPWRSTLMSAPNVPQVRGSERTGASPPRSCRSIAETWTCGRS